MAGLDEVEAYLAGAREGYKVHVWADDPGNRVLLAEVGSKKAKALDASVRLANSFEDPMKIYALVLLLLVSPVSLHAQASVTVDEVEARKSLIEHPNPVYPPIARAAHVSGDVVLQVEIDVTGSVSAATVLSGSPMLRFAAIDAVKNWKFFPLTRGGQTVSVITTMTIPVSEFSSSGEDGDASHYFPLLRTCVDLVTRRVDPSQQAIACKAAAAVADKFNTNKRFIERRLAYVYCATALMRNKDYKDTLICAEHAVAVVQLGHDNGSGSSEAYGVLGQAKALNGDLAAADTALTKAEQCQRAALNVPSGRLMSKEYTANLKRLMGIHEQVFRAQNKTAEADAKLREANSL